MTWSFNTDGFQSAVEYSPRTKKVKGVLVTKNGEALPEGFVSATKTRRSSHLLVRARVEGDLDKLRAYDPQCLFFEDLKADYQFRLIIKRAAVAQYQYDVTMGIDYWSHVKEEMNRRAPKSPGRMNAYYTVWTALSKIQPNPPYGQRPLTTHAGDQWWVDAKFRSVIGTKPLFAAGADTGTLDTMMADRLAFLSRWQLDLRDGRTSRSTMVGQVTDMLDDMMLDGDVENIVDQLQETVGTVDLDTVDFDEILAVLRDEGL